jgi:hypothetical protein
LPGWWLGEHDGRAVEPYVTAERWDEELKRAGFGGVNAVAYDGHLNNDIVAMPARNEERPKRLTILRGDTDTRHVGEVSSHLRKEGYELDFCTIDQTPAPGQDIVSLLDLEAPFLHSATSAQFDALKDFVAHIQDSGVLWVTGAAQIACRDPRYSLILGLARTIRNEHMIDFATLELEAFGASGWSAVANVLREFEYRIHDTHRDPDFEYACLGGKIQVGRYHWISVPKALSDTENQSFPKKLEMEKPGFIQSLHWKQMQSLPLVGDEVVMEIRAVGLNFKVRASHPSIVYKS